VDSFRPVSPPRPYTPPSPNPYAPHAEPISFYSILSPAQYWVRSILEIYFVLALRSNAGYDLHNNDVSRLQRHTTVGTTPLVELSTRRRDHYLTTQHKQETDFHDPGRIRTHILSSRAAADLRLRTRDDGDQLLEMHT